LDANYFQHQPYLDDFNAKKIMGNWFPLPPFIMSPWAFIRQALLWKNCRTEHRLQYPMIPQMKPEPYCFLKQSGLIKIDPDAGLEATKMDIIENPKNLDIVEIEAAQLARALEDVDMAVINGNYALQAGLNAATDALAKEEQDSLAAETYANVVAVREGEENNEKLLALVDAH
jgi:D-methionine transport system substrate-binding protein